MKLNLHLFFLHYLMNLAALCLEEAARRQEKVVTADIVNMITAEQTE